MFPFAICTTPHLWVTLEMSSTLVRVGFLRIYNGQFPVGTSPRFHGETTLADTEALLFLRRWFPDDNVSVRWNNVDYTLSLFSITLCEWRLPLTFGQGLHATRLRPCVTVLRRYQICTIVYSSKRSR